MPRCVYCGHDAGAYDEHDDCLEAALDQAELEADVARDEGRES